MRPDFIFFSKKADGSLGASIVDPHGHYLGDALPKLRGLANFGECFGGEFMRVESISKVGDTLRVLDLTRADVREAIRHATSAESLYKSGKASDY